MVNFAVMLAISNRHIIKSCVKDVSRFRTSSSLSPSALEGKIKWKERRNLVLAGSIALTAVSVAAFFKELRNFHSKLGIPRNILELDRGKIPYIYLQTDHLPKPRKKRKKKVWLPWLQSHSHDPWTLLQLAQSDDRSIRLMGTRSLAEQHHWHDADYHTLAQALDARTLVGLARTASTDARFFLPMPRLQKPSEDVTEDQLRKLLAKLPADGIDRCTQFFTSSALAQGKTGVEERGGLWCFGGTGLGFAESLKKVPLETVEVYCLKALQRHSRQDAWSFDGQGLLRELPEKANPSDVRLEKTFLYALYQHSRLVSHCHQIVNLGGLELLQRIYENRRHSIKVKRSIARILGNLAVCPSLQESIVHAGWVSVLSRWIRSNDLALSLHATKALANLDADFGEKRKYEDGVYLYHPQFRYSEPVYADIVFVHGLLGGPFRTWRQADPPDANKTRANSKTKQQQPATTSPSPYPAPHGMPVTTVLAEEVKPVKTIRRGDKSDDEDGEKTWSGASAPQSQCWPKDWLAGDFPNIRIVTVEYETHLSEWAPKCPYEGEKRSLSSRSSDMLQKLRHAGIGDRPIIWVGHSMGGLLIKSMLVKAREDPSLECLVKQSRGIVFYSVPHNGSPLASVTSQTAKYLMYPSVEVKELAQGCETLTRLHSDFRHLMFDDGIPLLSFGEGCKLDMALNMKLLVVPPESSDPGFGEFHFMPDLNHLNICKPENRQSPLYHLTLDFIRACLPGHLVEDLLRASRPEEFVLPRMS